MRIFNSNFSTCTKWKSDCGTTNKHAECGVNKMFYGNNLDCDIQTNTYVAEITQISNI